MKDGRKSGAWRRSGWCAMKRRQPAATCVAVGGVDPGGQLTASGGALRVDAMLGIGQQTLPGSIRPPRASARRLAGS
jgi:hypothetical protein